MRKSKEARFWEKVDKGGPPPPNPWRPLTSGCWLWQAGTRDGYGRFFVHRTPEGREVSVNAHVWAYQALVGDIPDGYHVDHLCRVRACVNPEHLEAVTQRINILRGNGATARNATKTHCPKGHPLTGDNVLTKPHMKRPNRRCRTCNRADFRKWYREQRKAS